MGGEMSTVHTIVEIIGWCSIALIIYMIFAALFIASRYDANEGYLDDEPERRRS